MPLTHNSYGKSKVRLTKVVRDGARHTLFEIDAAIQLEGDFDRAYTDGDNTACVATDSMKNTVYVLAKEHAFDSIEAFARILAEHFAGTYPQVSKATIELTQATWKRIDVEGAAHEHAFTGGGAHTRVARAELSRGAALTLSGGVRDLRVLKTTDSQWHTFVADRYRTLKDSFDRVLATRIDADWTYNALARDNAFDFDAADRAIHAAILKTFANHFSLGVQQTLLAMGEAALAACDAIDRVDFALPNLHRIPFNLEPFGLKFDNDIYVATDEPYGLINGSVVRSVKDEG